MSVPAIHVPMVDFPSAGSRRHSRGLGTLRAADPEKAPLPLAGVQLRARVADRVAEVSVEQKFHNPFQETIEAVYIFPLGGGCAVSHFELQVGARVVKGKVLERAEARQQYADALAQGKRAGLLEQERDDVFTVQVGNLAPGEEVTVRLTWSERLPFFEDGRTELRLPLVVAPRYVGGQELEREPAGHGTSPDTTTVPDASRITPPRLVPGFDPKVALGIEVTLLGAAAELECSQHATRVSLAEGEVRVQLSREREPLDRDFVLRWKLAGALVQSQLLVFRTPDSAYGMLSLLPPAREGFLGTPRDVAFLLDRSGSMQGQKIASAARACALLLRTLGPRDRFAIQAFDNCPEWMPGGFIAADEGGLERGEKWLRKIQANGGTELNAAMQSALAEVSGLEEAAGRAPIIVLLTDGEVGDESGVLRSIQASLGAARVFTIGIDTAVNSGFLRRLAALGGGTSTLVAPGARLEQALQAVGREIGAPLVTGLQISGGLSEAAPAEIPDLFAGRASCAFFRLPQGSLGSVRVSGRLEDGQPFSQEVQTREVAVPALLHLWARARVADLEDQFRAQPAEGVKQQIIALSVKHTVLTRFTAFLAVDEQGEVNQEGVRRTVVQPVETPAGWAPVNFLIPQGAGGAGLGGATRAMSAGAPPSPSRPSPAVYSPTPPSLARPSPASPLPASRSEKRSVMAAMKDLLGPKGKHEVEPVRASPPAQPPPNLDAIRKGLEALVAAFTAARAEAQAGKLAAPTALAAARKLLLEELQRAQELAVQLPLLQKFLRAAAVELIAALSSGCAQALLLPLFDRHARALEGARDEARLPLGTPGRPAAGSFWEASI